MYKIYGFCSDSDLISDAVILIYYIVNLLFLGFSGTFLFASFGLNNVLHILLFWLTRSDIMFLCLLRSNNLRFIVIINFLLLFWFLEVNNLLLLFTLFGLDYILYIILLSRLDYILYLFIISGLDYILWLLSLFGLDNILHLLFFRLIIS